MSAPWEKTRYPASFAGVGYDSVEVVADTRIELLADTVARPMIGDRWALMNKQENGLASGAYIFASLDIIEAKFKVRRGEAGTDRFGEFVRILRVRA
jgi:hypothetical protein